MTDYRQEWSPACSFVVVPLSIRICWEKPLFSAEVSHRVHLNSCRKNYCRKHFTVIWQFTTHLTSLWQPARRITRCIILVQDTCYQYQSHKTLVQGGVPMSFKKICFKSTADIDTHENWEMGLFVYAFLWFKPRNNRNARKWKKNKLPKSRKISCMLTKNETRKTYKKEFFDWCDLYLRHKGSESTSVSTRQPALYCKHKSALNWRRNLRVQEIGNCQPIGILKHTIR